MLLLVTDSSKQGNVYSKDRGTRSYETRKLQVEGVAYICSPRAASEEKVATFQGCYRPRVKRSFQHSAACLEFRQKLGVQVEAKVGWQEHEAESESLDLGDLKCPIYISDLLIPTVSLKY